MERITISLDEDLAREFDSYIRRRSYANRSEAIRDLLRQTLESEHLADEAKGRCVACLSYVYNHHERELSQRLTQLSHAHHDLIRSTVHVHLDHDNCMEVSILEGGIGHVRRFSDLVSAETGVRHGKLNAVPSEMARSTSQGAGHDHHHAHPHPHVHEG